MLYDLTEAVGSIATDPSLRRLGREHVLASALPLFRLHYSIVYHALLVSRSQNAGLAIGFVFGAACLDLQLLVYTHSTKAWKSFGESAVGILSRCNRVHHRVYSKKGLFSKPSSRQKMPEECQQDCLHREHWKIIIAIAKLLARRSKI